MNLSFLNHKLALLFLGKNSENDIFLSFIDSYLRCSPTAPYAFLTDYLITREAILG